MRKRRFTEEEKIKILREADAGQTVAEVTTKHNISEQTFYRWLRQYGEITVPAAKRLRIGLRRTI